MVRFFIHPKVVEPHLDQIQKNNREIDHNLRNLRQEVEPLTRLLLGLRSDPYQTGKDEHRS